MDSVKKRLVFMWLFVFAVYVPFFIFMVLRHDVGTRPMSIIGWSPGGIRYLILYVLLTLPFCLYLVIFFNKHIAGNDKFITVMAVISCVLTAAGAFIPIRRNVSEGVLLAHTVISVGGSVILMLTILYALIQHTLKQKYKAVILPLYGIYIAALLKAFYILYTAALFQLSAAVSFFIILLLNITVFYKPPVRTPLQNNVSI